jgi:hypothetical protein
MRQPDGKVHVGYIPQAVWPARRLVIEAAVTV